MTQGYALSLTGLVFRTQDGALRYSAAASRPCAVLHALLHRRNKTGVA